MTRIFFKHTDLADHPDACSRWDAHMELREREQHELDIYGFDTEFREHKLPLFGF